MRDLVLEARIEAESNIVGAAINRGAFGVRKGLAVLLDHWALPAPAIAKAHGSDQGGPGDHGIPEIGQLEYAFYRTLTAGQKDAFRDLKELVTELYERGMTWDGIDPFDVSETVEEWKMKAIAELAAHPMQAFLLGQYLATEAANGKTMRPLSTEDKRTIGFLEHYAFDEIHSSFDDLKANIRHALIEGMQQRKGPKEIARALENELNDHDTHWEMLAITETARAESQGRLQEFLDRGYKQVRGSSAHDSRVCPECLKLIDGNVVDIKDVIGQSNYGRKKADWLPVIPLHPRCVVGGTMVATPNGLRAIESIRPGDYVLTHLGRFRRVLATASREHSGIIFDVGGLRVTGNHPVLTPDGFRHAADLGERADVVGVSQEAWAQARANKPHDRPSERGEDGFLARILRALLLGRMPTAAIDLDGQHRIWYRQIDIENIDGELRNRFFTDSNQCVAHRALQSRHRASGLDALSASHQKLTGLLLTALAGMGGSDLRLAIAGAHAFPFDKFRLGSPAARQSGLIEPSRNRQATSADFLRELVHGLSREMFGVPGDDLLARGALRSPLVRSERIGSTTFSGHVYDLQVHEDESFVAEGIAIHNCRCVWLPVWVGKLATLPELLKVPA